MLLQCIGVDRRLIDPTGAEACEVTAVAEQREVEDDKARKNAVLKAYSSNVIAEAVVVVSVHEAGLSDELLAVGVVEKNVAGANRSFLFIDHLRIYSHHQIEV